MNNDSGNAVTGLKIFFQNLDRPPQTLVSVFEYPNDQAAISFTSLPVVIVSEALDKPYNIYRFSHDASRHQFSLEGLLFLAYGPVKTDPLAAEIEQLKRGWRECIDRSLYHNQTLYDNVNIVGEFGEKRFFNGPAGHINWWDKIYWGINFTIPVTQIHKYTD